MAFVQNNVLCSISGRPISFPIFKTYKMLQFSSDMDLVLASPENFLAECRGANNSLVCIGIESESEPEQRIVFLKKILAALQLELDRDTVYCSLDPTAKGSFFQLLKKKGIEKMVVFGLSPRHFGLGFSAQLYEPLGFYGCKFVFSEKLSVVEADQARKAKLWTALKAIF